MSCHDNSNSDKDLDDVYDYFQNELKSEQKPVVKDAKIAVEPSTTEATTVADLELKWAAEFSKDNDFIRKLEPELNKVINELNINDDDQWNMANILKESKNLKLDELLGSLPNFDDVNDLDGLEDEPIMGSLKNLMHKVLCKESLYPSIKNLVQYYPKWIRDHKDEYELSEIEKYEQQCAKMTEICNEFESFDETSTDEYQKSQHIDKIYKLMEEVQHLGDPPKELTGQDMAGSNQCILM